MSTPSTTSEQQAPARVSGFFKLMLKLQVWLLRHNLMGNWSRYVMAITTTGRKSGRSYTVPIGYLRDGDDIIAINPHGRSNWYRNALANPSVTLLINGETIPAEAEAITDPGEIARLFEAYQQADLPFERLFGIPADSPDDALIRARDSRRYMRFRRR